MSERRGGRGFTLVELLVVIGVIAILIAIAVPAMRGARTAAQSVGCQTNLRSLHLATAAYLNDYERVLAYAEVLIYYPTGDEDPLPALESYVDAPLPRVDAQGVVVTGQPWICPGDRGWGQQSGTSYDYFPAAIMGFYGHLETSKLFDEQPMSPLWTGHFPYHGWRNWVRYDGVLEKLREGEIY